MFPAHLIITLGLKAETQIAGQIVKDVTTMVKIRNKLKADRARRIRTLGEWVSTIQDINSLPEFLED